MAHSQEMTTAPASNSREPTAHKRVLFVDEDTHTVATLRSAFRRERVSWHTEFVQSGEEALAALERAPFDAIVSGLHIPSMDGPQLLALVRERHPEVVRLCLSEQLDDEVFLRAVPVAHQLLSKSCPPETVVEILERACSVGSLLQDSRVRQLISRLDALPATPRTFQELSAAIARPTTHTDDISDIVSRDQALAVKTLQLVNSALFRRSAAITSIPSAINFVGLEMLKSLALSACVFNALDAAPDTGRLLMDLQARSIRKARCARALLEGEHGADEAFTAALLLDLGQAVLALGAPERFAHLIGVARQRQLPWHELEPQYFGAGHAQVGACLLALWGLPLELIEAVAHHHRPSAVTHAHTTVLAAVHLADAIVEGTSNDSAPLAERLDGEFIARTEVARCLRTWQVDPGVDIRSLRMPGC
jgi:HD-like signal output (HDOD) protein